MDCVGRGSSSLITWGIGVIFRLNTAKQLREGGTLRKKKAAFIKKLISRQTWNLVDTFYDLVDKVKHLKDTSNFGGHSK